MPLSGSLPGPPLAEAHAVAVAPAREDELVGCSSDGGEDQAGKDADGQRGGEELLHDSVEYTVVDHPKYSRMPAVMP